MSEQYIWETFDSLFKTVHRYGQRLANLEARAGMVDSGPDAGPQIFAGFEQLRELPAPTLAPPLVESLARAAVWNELNEVRARLIDRAGRELSQVAAAALRQEAGVIEGRMEEVRPASPLEDGRKEGMVAVISQP